MYRLQAGHHDPVHEPRSCTHCWGTCRQEAPAGRDWCSECEQAAASSGDLRVVAWLEDLTQGPVSGQTLVDDLCLPPGQEPSDDQVRPRKG